MDNGSEVDSILNLTQKLLDSIANKDWEVYSSLVDEKVSCIEDETDYVYCEGIDFHKPFFYCGNDNDITIKENILQPNIKTFGDITIICYRRVRLITNLKEKTVEKTSMSETRIWKRFDNTWKLVHFHRS